MLEWSLAHGKAYAEAMDKGDAWIGSDPPDLLPGLVEWYGDFHRLSKDRQIGMAAGPIPHSTIINHTSGWPDEDADMFEACMDAMDAAYLKNIGKKPEPAPEPLSQEPVGSAFARMFGHKIK